MATKKPTTQYLLVLDGPYNQLPIALFGSWKECVEYAKANAPGMLFTSGPLNQAYNAVPWCWESRGVAKNETPYGYYVVKFVDGAPRDSAHIQPYTTYDPEEPKTGDKWVVESDPHDNPFGDD